MRSSAVAVTSTTDFAPRPNRPPRFTVRVCRITASGPRPLRTWANASDMDRAWYVLSFMLHCHHSVGFDVDSSDDLVVGQHRRGGHGCLNDAADPGADLRRDDEHRGTPAGARRGLVHFLPDGRGDFLA